MCLTPNDYSIDHGRRSLRCRSNVLRSNMEFFATVLITPSEKELSASEGYHRCDIGDLISTALDDHGVPQSDS